MVTEIKINGKPTGLYAVDVPVNSFDYRLMSSSRLVYDVDNYPKQLMYSVLLVIPGNYHKILGPITEHEIGFDCEPYVEKVDSSHLHKHHTYQSYNDELTYLATKEESFYSLLQSNGLYFVNPINVSEVSEEHSVLTSFNEKEAAEKLLSRWQSYQDRLVTKLLIIQKK